MKTALYKPTLEQFKSYNELFDYYNKTLFRGELPEIILNFSRKNRAEGFFAPDSWTGKKTIHEISLNPDTDNKEPKEVLSTLVHEMAHLWQQVFGQPSRTGYHNTQWAKKMEEVGLMPSDTGKVGGKKTGQRMCDYVIEKGMFDKAFKAMPKDLFLPFTAISKPKIITAAKLKTKYTCECDLNIWGKEGLNVVCTDCGGKFLEQ